jgi:cytochrome c-type biogenesis protein CcmH
MCFFKSCIKAVVVWGMVFGACLQPAHAFIPVTEQLPNAAQEQRAVALGNIIRCPVCAGQTINDSNNEMSKAMRAVVRERIAAGQDDAAVRDFFTERYGAEILLSPPKAQNTLLLWVFPLLGMLGGGFVLWRYFKLNKT